MAKKSASGNGTIRKKVVTRKGKEYTYWEARFTVGYDPSTGRQVQKSITGKTQKEVARKLKEMTTAVDKGTYTAPSKMTVGEWLDIWTADYLNGVKPRTVRSYCDAVRLYLKPAFGAKRLDELPPHLIQQTYNALAAESKTHKALSPKTVHNVHSVLHCALEQAKAIGYISINPSDACTTPRVVRKEMQVLDDVAIAGFLQAIETHPLRVLFHTTIFTGMRQSEILGLQWQYVDFRTGKILVKYQLQDLHTGDGSQLVTPKNDRYRMITPAQSVMYELNALRTEQNKQRQLYAQVWAENDFVFTNELGEPLTPSIVYKAFKKVIVSIGYPEVRFHDLRHSYAVAALRTGDDIKTVQGNLGHATASFTLDVYGHVTDQMKQESANRMERFIQAVAPAQNTENKA